MKGEWISRWDNEATEDVIYEDGIFVMRVPPGQGTGVVLCHNAALRAVVEEERDACYAAVEQYFSPENNDCCNHTLATIAGQIRARGGGA